MPLREIRGITTHVQQAGQGPDVVLLHAATSNLSLWMWSGLFSDLSRDFRVTAYDLRGHGVSGVTQSGYTSDQLAEDFAALHREFELEPAWLVGHSYGGVIAMQAAALFPERVRGVVLSDPYFAALAELEPHATRNPVWDRLRETLSIVGQDLGERVDFTHLFRVVAGLTPEQFAKIEVHGGAQSVRWLSQMPRLADTTFGDDMFAIAGLTQERLRSVRQPVIALYDQHSPFWATCHWLETNLPHCVVDTVPDAAHLAPVENPTAFNALVRKYLPTQRE
ncbi:MAG TPA: alpha/beta hydrolase [Pirellulaceae bacterium]